MVRVWHKLITTVYLMKLTYSAVITYLEEQYYVGKQIKVAFFHNALFIEQQATMSELHKNNEYQCEQIAYSDFESALFTKS